MLLSAIYIDCWFISVLYACVVDLGDGVLQGKAEARITDWLMPQRLSVRRTEQQIVRITPSLEQRRSKAQQRP